MTFSPQRRQGSVQEKILEDSMFPQCSAQRLGALGGQTCYVTWAPYLVDKVNKTLLSPQRRQGVVQEK